jgi:PAS domain S-box-containing protein
MRKPFKPRWRHLLEGLASGIGRATKRNPAPERGQQTGEGKCRGLCQNSRGAILTLEPPSWKFTAANAAAVKMFGLRDESELLSCGPWDLSPERQPDGRLSVERARETLEMAMQEGSLCCEWTYRRVGGQPFPADVFLARMEHEGRTMLQANVRDITERKRAEEWRARLGMAVEHAAETIVITDADGRILHVNPAFEKMTGYSRAEALGQTPRILQSGKHDADFYRQMWVVMTSGQVWRGHLVNKRKDGTLYEEDATLSPVFDTAGTVIGYVAVNRDVTAQVSLEKQLFQSQKLESIGRLAGGVAHDVNNILQAIYGYAQVLLDLLPAAGDAHGFAGEIVAAGKRAAALTHQLLAFARKQTIQSAVLDLNETIASMLAMLRRVIGEDIEMCWNPATGIPPVIADPKQIDQILANLVVNAREAIRSGGRITIETGFAQFDEDYCASHAGFLPGPYTMLAVGDTGCGMDGRTIARLFEPFFTTQELGKGAGLNLAMVHGIVRQNNGFIRVESEIGHGTTFRVYLPSQDAGTRTKGAPMPSALNGEAKTVLLVDDDATLLRATRLILEGLGYTVMAAGTPAQALQIAALHEGEIHVMLTDVIMPGMSGRDLRDHLARSRPSMACVFMSGYPADVISHHGVLDEDVELLEKPFSKATLAARLRKVLPGKLPPGGESDR